ncbi:MAG TPA: holo-ACP synthase [Tenericutes bacterium]|nr:holo-ACP synthase [Mycoplasmatota bacterium]
MIKGIGIDIVSIPRIEKKVEQLANRILSEKEKKLYETITSKQEKLEFVAGRFAAKEAYIKATNLKEVNFKKIEVLKRKNGAPYIESKENNIHVSISHSEDNAVAVVIISKN